MTKLLLVRGLPGSGKSTKAKFFVNAGGYNCHFEADMYFVNREGVYEFNPEYISDAHQWCQEKTLECLKAGLNTVVSNTFVKKWEMDAYVSMAEELDVELIVKTVRGEYGNSHGVPAEVIERMRSDWEK